ncbi:transcription factor bHLH18-like [Pistacia vera]|uniref:transcription factor bHLH18-like n=1 Tax=Pistacia vera TaxID=55513 RepID=UPI0012634AE4|nr:transcription factor bHLH18-like [Pistacia vera]
MEISSAKWISELEMDDSAFFNQYQMNPLDYTLDGLDFQSFFSGSYYPESTHNSSGSYIEASHTGVERPAKQLKTNSWNSCTTELTAPKHSPSSSSQIISFDNSVSSSPAINQQAYDVKYPMNPKNESAGSLGNINLSSVISRSSHEAQFRSPNHVQETKRVGSVTRAPLLAQDHVIAERKRREKLNQRFIALSALVPGLKKTDKATVLADAIKYMKQLQELVKTLEEQAAKKTMESTIIVKKSQISSDDETSSSDENFDSQSDQYLPEIEARVSDRDILIRIHCEQIKGSLVKIISEVEKLNLTVLNSNVFSFGNSTLDITIVAQMDSESDMTIKDLVKNLRLAVLEAML